MIFWIHPFLQTVGAVCALYALSLGWRRFCVLHLKKPGAFAWKRHVFWGSAALAVWCCGAVGGALMTRLEWGAFFLTGAHARTGWIFVGLAVFGFISGRIMDMRKKRRLWLPLLHGITNLLLIVLFFAQAWTGWDYLP